MIIPCATLSSEISSGRLDQHFDALYGPNKIDSQKRRYLRLLDLLAREKPGAQTLLVIAPGRTELAGNHTDHNHGCVLAAAVDLDCVAAVTPIDNQEVVLISEDYPSPIRVNLHNLELRPEEQGSPEALVRGVAAVFFKHTGIRHGFCGHLHATCLPGTGLSSSAAFSVLVGAIFNFLFNDGRLSGETLAVMARKAENDYFGKPCGLMDQMASALGRTIFIDFLEPERPSITRIKHTLDGTGYQLAIIDTGGSHVKLTQEYTSIPAEMRAAAEVLGQPFGRGITFEMFLANITEIRNQAGDRAALRLLHFIEENDRTQTMARLLKEGSFQQYLHHVEASGASSCSLLQNCTTNTGSHEQGILVALSISRRICPRAVCRVHGGGFAGTVQVYVPNEELDFLKCSMERIFGKGSVMLVQLGRPGVCALNGDGLTLPFEEVTT
jgi:galactokinase